MTRPAQAVRPSLLLTIVFLTAFNFRTVYVGVQPVLPQIRSDLHLTYTLAGIVNALPILCFGLAALPGSVLANRFGPRRLIAASLFGLVAGGLARLLPPESVWILIGTAIFSFSVAMAPPAFMLLLRTWFGASVQRVSSVYIFAMTAGGLTAASLTLYLSQLVGWRGTFIVWSFLALAAAILWVLFTPESRDSGSRDWAYSRLISDPSLWRVAALFGAQNFMYFTVASWLPFALQHAPIRSLSFVLFLLNGVPLPLFVALAVIRWSYATSASFYMVGGLLATVGALGLALGLESWAWALATLLGLGTAAVAAAAFAAPAVLARSTNDVAAYSALVLAFGYPISFFGPFLGGVLVDSLHSLAAPFWPVVAAGVLILVLGATMLSWPHLSQKSQ